MPISGGASDKIGNRYEGRWTVLCIADVLDELADSICLEPLGSEGDGIEFWLRRGDMREFHQVKRQQTNTGRWTLADLTGNSVLRSFREKLREPTACCVFVSGHAAHELEELSQRARDASSWDLFERECLKTDAWLAAFQRLCTAWPDCSSNEAYELLRRVHADQTIGESVLLHTVRTRLMPLVDGEPANVAAVLAQFALDSVHQELTAHDIWRHLQERGFRRRTWGNDPHVLAAIEAANRRYAGLLRSRSVGDGIVIAREEAAKAVAILRDEAQPNTTLVSGEAGVGKTGVVLQIREALAEAGWPCLAFRLDRLNPTLLPEAVGQQLGLPGSPVSVLAAVAQGRDCVLVIDQLDAVSLASGRNPSFFQCVEEILQEVRAHPCMRLVLACRKFDLANDHRLRALVGPKGIAKEVPALRLAEDVVKDTVTRLGTSAEGLTRAQLRMLSLPLHLDLFAEIAESGSDPSNCETAKALYDLYWERKRLSTNDRAGRPIAWMPVIEAVADYMSDHQCLVAPADHLGELVADVDVMASEHVLVKDMGSIAFFHEGFFDYAFARCFVGQGRTLENLLAGDMQDLFRRAQVRQILLHQRGQPDRSAYLADLSWLLQDAGVRSHLRQVVFGLLAELTDPTPDEWEVLAPLTGCADPFLKGQAWSVLRRSSAWFRLVDSMGVVEQWLAEGDDEGTDWTVTLLRDAHREHADRIAALVAPYVGRSAKWDKRLVFLVQWANLHVGRAFFDLFLRLVDEGLLDRATDDIASNGDFWSLIYGLMENKPEWGCEAVRHYLDRRVVLARAEGVANPFEGRDWIPSTSGAAEGVLEACASGAPLAFVGQLLPFMLDIMEGTTDRTEEPPWRDPVWHWRVQGPCFGMDGWLLRGMEAAMRALAAERPNDFLRVANRMLESSFETVQFLLLRAFAANAPEFADLTIDYLLASPARLSVGYHDSGHWVSREAIAVAGTYCDESRYEALETALMGYTPDWEKGASYRRWRGTAQLTLLGALPSARVGARVAGRLRELRRKLGPGAIRGPQDVAFHEVPPPIPAEAAPKMTDAQWLRAIATYDREEMPARYGRSPFSGAHQLAGLLETEAKKAPGRFARLVLQFPDNVNVCYFDAVLRGIAGAAIDSAVLLDACYRCHALPGRPCSRWICDPIARLAEEDLPEEALAIVGWCATEHTDPERELWRTRTQSGDVYYGGSILTAGLNSARGNAANAMSALLFHRGARAGFFLPYLEQMVTDPSIAVRAWITRALTSLAKHDPETAIRLFLQLVQTEDVLLATHYVEEFLSYGLQTGFARLQPVVDRMLQSDSPEVVTAGARRACLAAFSVDEALPLARKCAVGTPPQRLGAAQIAEANVREPQCRELCEEVLLGLFHDTSDEVLQEVARCFGRFEGDELAGFAALVDDFVRSPAFSASPACLLRALGQTTAKLPAITLRVCERVLGTAADGLGDPLASSARHAGEIDQLVIRVHSQNSDARTRETCLDLIDRMVEAGTFGLGQALGLYER